MADVSDLKINEGAVRKIHNNASSLPHEASAYEDVRSVKSDTNWVLIDYEVRLWLLFSFSYPS
jgi:hypothetical protein